MLVMHPPCLRMSLGCWQLNDSRCELAGCDGAASTSCTFWAKKPAKRAVAEPPCQSGSKQHAPGAAAAAAGSPGMLGQMQSRGGMQARLPPGCIS